MTKIKKITPNTPLSEILQISSKAAELLFESGMSCIGCPMAMQETLSQGCMAHGMNEKEIKTLVDKMNKEIEKEKTK